VEYSAAADSTAAGRAESLVGAVAEAVLAVELDQGAEVELVVAVAWALAADSVEVTAPP
jgi:hypothetical protein